MIVIEGLDALRSALVSVFDGPVAAGLAATRPDDQTGVEAE